MIKVGDIFINKTTGKAIQVVEIVLPKKDFEAYDYSKVIIKCKEVKL